MKRRPTAIDLFSGAGGFSLGVEQAGFDVVAAVEFDPIHAATHHINFPLCKTLCERVEDVEGSRVLEAADIVGRDPDLVIGGPPCQGFSLIGHRVLEDSRNALVFHFLRLVRELRPRYFVMENVPGMATGAHTQLLHELIERFEQADYQIALPYRTLNAVGYGVPQLRDRLFLLGARVGEALPGYPLPATSARTGRGNNGVPDRGLGLALPTTPTVSMALDGLPPLEPHDSLFGSDELPISCRDEPRNPLARRLASCEDDPTDFGYRRRDGQSVLTGCRRARHTDVSITRFRSTKPGTTEPVSRFYRLPPDGYSNTLRAGTASNRGAFTAPRPIHPRVPRCITVREAARLHTFPDWFRFHSTIWHGFRQIGNAVPPLLGRAVGAAVMAALNRVPARPKRTLDLGNPQLAKLTMSQAAKMFGVNPHVIAPRTRRRAAS